MKQQLFIVCLLCLLCEVFSERTILFNITSKDKLYNNYYKKTLNIDIPLLCTQACIEDVATPCISFAYYKLGNGCYLYNHMEFGNTYHIRAGIMTYTPIFDEVEKDKPTNQSTTFQENDEEYGSHKAIDGDVNTYMKTSYDGLSWWCVDLLQIHSMRLIQIINAQANANEMGEFYLSFGMTGNCDETGLEESIGCYYDTDPEKTHYDITKCNYGTNPTDMRAKVIFISQVYNVMSVQYSLYFSELNILLDNFDSSNCNIIN